MSHSHLTDEELVFHYYGEEGETLETESHLEECGECRSRYNSLQYVLNMVDAAPVPLRDPEYGSQVWRRIAGKLPVRRRAWWSLSALRYALASGVMAALLTGAFMAGRLLPHRPAATQTMAETLDSDRILLVAVGDYLDRSQMVLIELANANGKDALDISSEQERVQDLLNETRLYRQTAAATGATEVTSILDELERVLLDIAHGPSRLSPVELKTLRARLSAENILFKIRVVNSNLRSRQDAPRQTL